MTGTAELLARFREAADVPGWAGCLDELVQTGGAADARQRAERLTATVCVAVFLEWLARISGDLDAQERATGQLGRLRAQLLATAPDDGPDRRLAWFPLLVRDGYGEHAQRLLDELARDAPELLAVPEWLVLRHQDRDVRTLVGLRERVRGAAPTRFLPAAFEYGLALVNVGAVREAARLVADGPWDADHPFLREVRGSIGERLGEWPAALRAYAGSPWPSHHYRAGVVAAIAGRPELIDALRLDEPVCRVLFQLDGDLDQAELARSTAFRTACQWHPVVNWLLELELGKLSFRRRQFAEADVHYQRALAGAPPDARRSINGLRFFNLTWLTDLVTHPSDGAAGDRLTLRPEALAAGHDALDPGGTGDAEIRTWMAAEVGDHSLIPAALDAWGAYERANAHRVLGDTARAIDGWLDCLHAGYQHRAAQPLIQWLYSGGLTRAAVRLADTVLTASQHDFLALWETGDTVQRLLPTTADADPDAEADEVGRVADRYRDRLVELSRFEFMNALRSHALLRRAGYEDLAEELLLRAAKQAESVSELLAIAMLRRIGPIRSVHSDQEGLRCLARARRLARDRRDRLEIAREYLLYDGLREGRTILTEENVLREDVPLSHSELIVALQCWRGCTAAERADLVLRAVRRINDDFRAGLLGRYPATYATRLLDTVRAVLPAHLPRARHELDPRLVNPPGFEPWAGPYRNGWPDVREQIEGLVGGDADPDPGWLAELPGLASFGLRLLVVTHLRDELTAARDAAERVVPALPAARTPIAKAIGDGDSQRTIQLCDLWRSRLLGNPPADDGLLRGFLETERTLLAGWETERAAAGAPHLRRVVRVGEMLRTALGGLLTPDQPADRHPVLAPVFAAMQRDVRSRAAEVAAHVGAARRQLAAAGPAPEGGSGP